MAISSENAPIRKVVLGILTGVTLEILLILSVLLTPGTSWRSWGNAHFGDLIVIYPTVISFILLIGLFLLKKPFRFILGIFLGILIFIIGGTIVATITGVDF